MSKQILYVNEKEKVDSTTLKLYMGEVNDLLYEMKHFDYS
jgi:hypothetical protein